MSTTSLLSASSRKVQAKRLPPGKQQTAFKSSFALSATRDEEESKVSKADLKKEATESTTSVVKELIYASVSKHLNSLADQVGIQNKEEVFKSIKLQMSESEDRIAEKALKALRSLDTRLQKEITNFINLKTKIAIAKSGIDPRILPRE